MKVTKEFDSVCIMFNQDLDVMFPHLPPEDGLRELIKGGLASLTGEEKERLKTYLADILDGNLNDEELADLWDTSSADVGTDGPGVKWIMTETLERL